MTQGFNTDAVAPEARFAFYREVALGSLYRMTAELKVEPESFWSAIAPSPIGEALAVRCQGTPHSVSRTGRDIAAQASDCYFIFQQIGERGTIFQPGDSVDAVPVRSGDLVLGDADTVFTTPQLDRYDHVFWMLPKPLLDPVLPGAAAKLARTIHVSGSHGFGALLSTYLETLRAEANHPDVAANRGLTAHLSQLVAMTLGAVAPDDPQRAALAEARRRHARVLIEGDYRDPALSAEKVARRLGISIRSLHSAFEPSGTSFAEALTLRRLQAARILLANPAARHQSVAAIAFACGFNDVSTFHRAFRRVYGNTPSDLRP